MLIYQGGSRTDSKDVPETTPDVPANIMISYGYIAAVAEGRQMELRWRRLVAYRKWKAESR